MGAHDDVAAGRELADKAADLLQGARREVLHRIQSVNDTSERKVLAVGRALQAILNESQAQAQELRHALQQLRSAAGELDCGVSEAILREDERSARVVERSREALSHLSYQDACAQRLLSVDAVLQQLSSGVALTIADPASAPGPEVFASVLGNAELHAGDVVALRERARTETQPSPAPGEMILF